MAKTTYATLYNEHFTDNEEKGKPELPPNARFEKTRKVIKLLVPVLISILWSLSNIASYQMGVSAGRAKTVTDDILNRVAQDAFQEGVDKGYFEGLSKNISAFLPTSAVKGE